MNVYTAEGTQSFFVSSGSYTVNNDSTVSIIAEEACKLSDLDKEAATKALAAAQVNDFPEWPKIIFELAPTLIWNLSQPYLVLRIGHWLNPDLTR